MNGGCQDLQNCGDEKIHSDGERGETEEEAGQILSSTDVLFRV